MAFEARLRAANDTSERWRAELARSFFGLRASPLASGQAITGSLDGRRLDDVGVFRMDGSSQQVVRRPAEVRSAPSDDLKLCAVVRGRGLVVQEGNEVEIDRGQMALYDTARPYRLVMQGPWQVSVMTVDRSSLALSETRLHGLMEHAIGLGSGPGMMLSSYLRDLLAMPSGINAVGQSYVRDAGVALLSGALRDDAAGPASDAADETRRRVLGWIEAHLADPDLTPERIAAEHHMAPRTLQRLFAAAGISVSGTVRRLRLEAIRRDLADPTTRAWTISAVAARHGIHDQAWLSRAFRAEYGESPTAFRERPLGQDRG